MLSEFPPELADSEVNDISLSATIGNASLIIFYNVLWKCLQTIHGILGLWSLSMVFTLSLPLSVTVRAKIPSWFLNSPSVVDHTKLS